MTVDESLVKEGIEQWSRCQLCHGPGAVAGGTAPDLRATQIVLDPGAFATTVRNGLEPRGMPKFAELTDRELDALRHYVRYRARLATRPGGVAPPPPATAAPVEEAPPEPPPRPPGSLESERNPPPR
jgi:quinohemoprotein ethanol dehydrogenase